jgi:flavin reductase (DIM6/NTAB) family NADH-FMN oxidoreductase RutF
MRQWTTGVAVLSSCHADQQHGMTVSSFTSVSLDPPEVLVSLSRLSRAHALVARSGVFGVTILAEEQREIAERFAGRTPDEADRFVGLETFPLVTGSPFICGGLAFLDCEVSRTIATGGNTLFFGRVIAAQAGQDGKPLVYHQQGYQQLNGL